MDIGDVRMFDRFAPVYDRVMPGANAQTLEDGLARAERPVDRLLDVGGGSGRASVAIDATEPVVVDASAGMLGQARRRGLGAVQADAANLPVRSGTVDAITIVDALHHVADQRGAIEEAWRVLAAGGVLVVSEFDPSTRRGRALVALEHLVGFASTFHAPDDLADVMRTAGFDVAVTDRGFGYTVSGLVPSRTE